MKNASQTEKKTIFKAQVCSNLVIKPRYYRISLQLDSKDAIAFSHVSPGQFVQIQLSGIALPPAEKIPEDLIDSAQRRIILRRPFSLCDVSFSPASDGPEVISILYRVSGPATLRMTTLAKGDKVSMIGPLGNGFKIRKNSKSLKMLVGGGMGVAPLLGLAEELCRGTKKKFVVILGAKTQNHILCDKEFKKLGAEVYIATEDGSRGKKALATELTRDIAKSKNYKRQDICVYAAGPMAMVKALCALTEGCSLESQVSLEERMACGLGACLGCAIDTQSGYKRVCKDGPVFPLCEII